MDILVKGDPVTQRENPMASVPIGSGTMERAFAMLDALALSGPLTAAAAAQILGLPRPTVYRMLGTLTDLGVLTSSGGTFHLGVRPHLWGAHAAPFTFSLDQAQAVLETLRDETGESAQLFVREGEVRVCIAVAEPELGLRDSVPLGSRLPIDRGSGGRIFQVFDTSLPANSRRARKDDEHIRSAGWAASVAERARGVASVSAPVREGAAVVAVVSVSGPADRFTQTKQPKLAKAVLGAAKILSSTRAR